MAKIQIFSSFLPKKLLFSAKNLDIRIFCIIFALRNGYGLYSIYSIYSIYSFYFKNIRL